MQFVSSNLSSGCIIQRHYQGLSYALPGSYRRKGKINPSECRFQRIARRDKKAFLSEQCKEIEDNNRIGKIRDLLKKIRDTQGMFHEKKSTKKTEDIKKSWQEYTEELYKKDLNDTDNHDGMITYLELGILQCEVKQASGSITTNKATGGDGTPGELFQILKDNAVKLLPSICQKI